MREAFAAIDEFHAAFDPDNRPDTARLLPQATQDLRFALIVEEFHEYREATEAGDLVSIADALADLAYVVIGSAVAHGLVRFGDIFAEVHRSNMSKLGADGKPVLRADGKVLKGPNFSPPDLKPLVIE